MRRLLLLVVLACVTLGGAGLLWMRTSEAAAPYRPVGPGDTYLALGDSLAAGFTVGDPGEAYVARIDQALKRAKPGIALRNFSVPGETSGSFRARQLPRALALIASEQAAGRRVSPITIDIGGNDARAVERADSAARAAAMQRVAENTGYALDALLRATRDRWGRRTADIVVMNYYNPYGGDSAQAQSPAYWMAQLNQAIERAATGRHIPVANAAQAFAGGLAYRYTYIMTGDIHANADGHRVIAEQFWRALQYSGTIGQP